MKKINNFIFKLNSYIHRKYINYFRNDRVSSYPYISGDSFRSAANLIYETGNSRLDPLYVKNNDKIFVESSLLKKFFSDIHPLVKNKYILISHNGDDQIDNSYIGLIDKKIIHWFGQNVTTKHEKITPLPIGLENLHYYYNGITSIFKKTQLKNTKKQNKILYGFSVSTNPFERQPANDSLIKNRLSEKISNWPNPKEYIRLLNKYKFVASPPGSGPDCHRTWEAMYLKTVPIVKRSVLTEYFYNIGCPMWIIDDWKEIENIDEEFLSNKYKSLETRFNSPTLYADYWIKKFNTKINT